jgi:hypothetical protein
MTSDQAPLASLKKMRRTIVKKPRRYPRHDFSLQVTFHDPELSEEPEYLFSAWSSLKDLDPRRIDLGDYQFSQDMARMHGKRRRQYSWIANVSVQAAVWIIQRYVSKFLVNEGKPARKDRNVVISKREMKDILSSLLEVLNGHH